MTGRQRPVSLGPSCLTCKHLRSLFERRCDAFPDVFGIPEPILSDEHEHLTPYRGDHGIQYEPDEDEVRRWNERGT